MARRIKDSTIVCTDTFRARKALLSAPIFCINDSDDNDTKTLENHAKFMTEHFPEKSSFEK